MPLVSLQYNLYINSHYFEHQINYKLFKIACTNIYARYYEEVDRT